MRIQILILEFKGVNDTQRFRSDVNLGPVHTYPFSFENATFSGS